MNTIYNAQSITPPVIYSGDIKVSLGAHAPSPTGFKKPSTKVSTTATLKFIEAPAGYGKTRALSKAIRSLKERGERVLVVLPQRDLIAAYQIRNPDWTYIYTGSDTEKKAVTQVALDALCSYDPVVVITQECMERLARLISVNEDLTEALSLYNVFLDEVAPAKAYVCQYVENGKELHNADWLPYLIEVEKNIYETTRHDIAQAQATSAKYAASFRAFAHHLAVGGQVQMIKKAGGTLYSGLADKASFRLLGTAKTLMLMGAAVERMSFVTRAQELFGKASITIEQDKTLIPVIKPYANTERCTFFPLISGKASFANTKDNFEELCKTALKVIPAGESFLYVANKDNVVCAYSEIADRILGGAGGIRLPFNSQGINDFAGFDVHGGVVSMVTTDPTVEDKTLITADQYQNGIHHCIFLGMANLKPDERKWLSPEMIDAVTLERGAELCFQALTRTTLRNFNDEKTPHVFVVADATYAKYGTSKWLPDAVIVDGDAVAPVRKRSDALKERDASFFDAIQKLHDAGKKVTPKAIVELTGMQLQTVKDSLKKWRKQQVELDQLVGGAI